MIDLLKLCRVKGTIFFHCPNGEARSEVTGAKLKAMGVLPGVADIVVITPGGSANFLELKAPKKTPSPDQITFREACEANGCPYALADSADKAMDALVRWGAVNISDARQLKARR